MALLAALALIVGACGGTARSTGAFCNTLRTDTSQIRAEIAPQIQGGPDQSKPLVELLAGARAIGEYKNMIDTLASKAPTKIQNDMQKVANLIDNATRFPGVNSTSLLGAGARLLLSGALASGSIKHVDDFAKTSCGMPAFGV
jgi:hypothetical protein